MAAKIFSDTVNRIVLRVACTEGHEDSPVKQQSLNYSGAGPLTRTELSDLSLLCTQQNHQQGFASVEGEQLLALLSLLTRHIDNAVTVDFIVEALQVMKRGETPSRAAAVLDEVGLCDVCGLLVGRRALFSRVDFA